MSNWIPVVSVGLINLIGLAFAVGVASQRLKATESKVEKLPEVCEKQAAHLDLKHLYECHPRAAKRATGQAEIVQ